MLRTLTLSTLVASSGTRIGTAPLQVGIAQIW
jgi:hypothetical protein